MNRNAWLFAFLSAAALPFACTFPDVTFSTGSSSSSGSGSNGGAMTSGNPTNGGTNTTQNTGGVGPGGLGGAGGAGGTIAGTGVTTSGGGFGGASSDPCPGATDPCDCDGDGHRHANCPGDDGTKPPDDCADHDSRAHPGATKAYGGKINGPLEPGNSLFYDYDCDGHETPTWPDQMPGTCVLGCSVTEGWKTSTIPGCGEQGDLKKCHSCTISDEGNTTQTCL